MQTREVKEMAVLEGSDAMVLVWGAVGSSLIVVADLQLRVTVRAGVVMRREGSPSLSVPTLGTMELESRRKKVEMKVYPNREGEGEQAVEEVEIVAEVFETVLHVHLGIDCFHLLDMKNIYMGFRNALN